MNSSEEALAEVPRHSVAKSTFLHLLPGIALLAGYAILAAVLTSRGYPNILALILTTVFIEVPVIWWLLVRFGREESGGRVNWRLLFPWRKKVPLSQAFVIGGPLILFSVAIIGGLGSAVDPAIREMFFEWVPDWFVLSPDMEAFMSMPRGLLIATWLLTLFGLTILGGVTQEVYFRGYLLPRMNHHGPWAPALNALLFAIFHLTSPWSWPTFFVMVLPWAYVVRWKRSLQLGVTIHVGMLLLQWLGMTMLVFGLVEMPS